MKVVSAVLILLLWCLISDGAHAQSCTPNNNSSFQINGNTLSTINPLSARAYTVGVVVNMTGVGNSGTCFPVTVTGQQSGGLTLTVNGSSSGATVAPSASMSVAVTNGPGNPSDWLGVCTTATPSSAACDGAGYSWDYLQNCTQNKPSTGTTNNTCSLTAPASAGSYTVNLFNTAVAAYSVAAAVPVTVSSGGGPDACAAIGTIAQNDLAAIGFTTCAVGNDFTQQIPNTAGTGLTNNWLNCTIGDTTSSLWYYGFDAFITPTGANAQNPCVSGSGGNVNNSAVYQANDPTYGNMALVLRAPAAHCTDNSAVVHNFTGGGCSTAIQSTPTGTGSDFGVAWPHSGVFPSSYMEITYRSTNVSDNNQEAFWTWVQPAEQSRTSGLTQAAGCCYNGFEIDQSLQIPGQWNMQSIQWFNHQHEPDSSTGCQTSTGLFCGNDQYLDGSSLDTAYHTFAALFTTDGNNKFAVCFYFDTTKRGCHKNTFLDPNDQEERRDIMWWANTMGTNDTYVYVKSIKVLSCSNWQNSMCHSSLVAPVVTINGAPSATVSRGTTITVAGTFAAGQPNDTASICVPNPQTWTDCGGSYDSINTPSGQTSWSVTLTAPSTPGNYVAAYLPGGCVSCAGISGAFASLTVN